MLENRRNRRQGKGYLVLLKYLHILVDAKLVRGGSFRANLNIGTMMVLPQSFEISISSHESRSLESAVEIEPLMYTIVPYCFDLEKIISILLPCMWIRWPQRELLRLTSTRLDGRERILWCWFFRFPLCRTCVRFTKSSTKFSLWLERQREGFMAVH
jgi:hypothetical protein